MSNRDVEHGIAIPAPEALMSPSTHVLWHGWALCEDERLRGVPRQWPAGQRWISLQVIADDGELPSDLCPACFDRTPQMIAELRQIGKIA